VEVCLYVQSLLVQITTITDSGYVGPFVVCSHRLSLSQSL